MRDRNKSLEERLVELEQKPKEYFDNFIQANNDGNIEYIMRWPSVNPKDPFADNGRDMNLDFLLWAAVSNQN